MSIVGDTASRAPFSNISRIVSPGAYFLYHQHHHGGHSADRDCVLDRRDNHFRILSTRSHERLAHEKCEFAVVNDACYLPYLGPRFVLSDVQGRLAISIRLPIPQSLKQMIRCGRPSGYGTRRTVMNHADSWMVRKPQFPPARPEFSETALLSRNELYSGDIPSLLSVFTDRGLPKCSYFLDSLPRPMHPCIM